MTALRFALLASALGCSFSIAPGPGREDEAPAAAPAEPAPSAPAPPDAGAGSTPALPAPAPPPDGALPAEVTAMVQIDGGPAQPVKMVVGNELPPGVYPPPFGIEELRAGMPKGTRLKYRITRADRPAVISTWEVVDHSETGFTFRLTDAREDGSLYAPPRDEVRWWVELRNHAAFPKAEYTRAETTLRWDGEAVPAWLYEMRPRADGLVERTWFARSLPGPPTLYLVEERGRETMRMELLERSP